MNKTTELINKNKDILCVLGKCKQNIRKGIINNADKELINTICQCVYNLLKGNIELTNQEKDLLLKYKQPLRKLIKKSSIKNKKKILIQQGGFLNILIPAVITGLSSIISSFISSNNDN